MIIQDAMKEFATIVQNGPIGTRLKYDYGFENSFLLSENSMLKNALIEIYQGDIDIAKANHLPIILNAATYRASKNHLDAAGLKGEDTFRTVNSQSISVIREIQACSENAMMPIFLGAPLGSIYDAYSIKMIPSVSESEEYHKAQIAVFKNFGVDVVNAVTLPSIPEALGIALAAEEAKLEYFIGFILDKNGLLLDGSSLLDGIHRIDTKVNQRPLGYLVTCTHASVIRRLEKDSDQLTRLIGIQANGSSLSLDVLAQMKVPQADPPAIFADDILRLKKSLSLKIISGCCGTTSEHLREIAERIASYKK